MHRTSVLALGVFAVVSVFGTSAQAGYYTNGSWSTSPDEGTRELYGDAIDDYSGTGSSNLNNCIDGLEKFIDRMEDISYTHWRYSTDEDAWSTDFEASGSDHLYGDAGEFGYFSGHGSTGKAKFNGSSGDDLYATETELGDNDLEFMAFDSCKTLNASGRSDFIAANLGVGAHLIMGFESNASDITTTAKNYGKYLKDGYSVRSAWISATRDGHDASRTGAYVRFTSAACNTYSDTATSFSCDPEAGAYTATSTWTL